MFTGDTRRSQSTIFFNNKSKQGEETSNRASKRKLEEQTPTILVEQASTCTLNSLHYRKTNSKGFKTWIRAHNWTLWIGVCRRMVFQIERFFTHTNERHSLLWKDHQIYKWEHQKYWSNFQKVNRKPENFQTLTKYWKQMQKLPNVSCNYLNYKLQPIKEQTPVITQANFKKPYANAVKGKTDIIDPKVQHLWKTSKTNIQEEPPNFLKKLKLLHPAHTQHHCMKSPTRVPSATKQTSTNRDKEIEDLRNQIKLLKQNQKEHDTQEQPTHTENKEKHAEPKKNKPR